MTNDELHEHIYDVLRVNTFANKVQLPDKTFHRVHEYHDTLMNIYLDEFLCSESFKLYTETSGKSSISYTTFIKGAFMCPCIKAPKIRVCVDEIETSFCELSKCLQDIRRQKPATKKFCCEACSILAEEKARVGEKGMICCLLLLLSGAVVLKVGVCMCRAISS
jgi:hypothetical protein